MPPKGSSPKRANHPVVHNRLDDRGVTPGHAIARPRSGFAQNVHVPEGPESLGNEPSIFKPVINS